LSTGRRDDIRAEGAIDDQRADLEVAVIPTALIAGRLGGNPHAKAYPVTARPMTDKEKRRYTQWKNR